MHLLPETDDEWSPSLSLEEAHKRDDVREALRRGDLKEASRRGRVCTLIPVAVTSTTVAFTRELRWFRTHATRFDINHRGIHL